MLDLICHAMWSLTPYAKCEFRCVYCCTYMQGSSVPHVAPPQYLSALRGRLRDIPRDDLLIIGAFCDGYPPCEAEMGITRLTVLELIDQQREFVIVTKGLGVRRDADLLASYARCKVQISVSSVDDDVLRRLEPEAPTASERFALLHELHAARITVGLNALPWIPGISDTAALIGRVPAGVEIVFAPLACGFRDSMTLLGTRYTRDEINARYLAEYRRFGHLANTSWVEPKPPPDENHPLYRLPVLSA